MSILKIKVPALDVKESRGNPPVSTITFFKGTPPVEEIEERVAKVVGANPWLVGRYRKDKGSKGGLLLEYDGVPDAGMSAPEQAGISELTPSLGYDDMQSILKPYLVNGGKMGRASYPNPLFRVTVNRPDNAKEAFSITVSMCHTLGDGYTYYRLLEMLAGSAPVVSLIAERLDRRDAINARIGKVRRDWFFSAPNVAPFVFRMMLASHRTIYRYIDEAWLAEQKDSFTLPEDVGFVSSNDIVCSMLMNELQLDSCLMATNPRGRVAGLGDEHAGDYFGPLVFVKGEWDTPAHTRRVVDGTLPDSWSRKPGILKSLKSRTGVLSNWSAWNCSFDLPGCEQQLHIPLFARPLFPTAAVIWRPRPGRLGLLLNAPPPYCARIAEHPAFMEAIIPE